MTPPPCPLCSHLPSCRFGDDASGVDTDVGCRCECHDLADRAPEAFEAVRRLLASWDCECGSDMQREIDLARQVYEHAKGRLR